jgi:long-chain acyl-CoA synthetase
MYEASMGGAYRRATKTSRGSPQNQTLSINTAGFKVWPREVEEIIYAHPAVKLEAVIGVEDAYRGEVVKACVVLKEGHRHEVDQAAVVSFCQERLMPYKVPRIIEFREELPVSAAGKMLRRLLRGGAE